MSRIDMVPASELRPGDVFSTDGGRVGSVTLLSGGGAPDEIAVYVICHGVEKFAYLAPDHLCPVWCETDDERWGASTGTRSLPRGLRTTPRLRPMPNPLATVTQAAERKREAEQGYRDALNRARATESVQAIARAAGVTRQAVYKVLNRRDKA